MTVRWYRTTRELNFANVHLKHGDHYAARAGHVVAILTRKVNGRWRLWLAKGDGYEVHGDYGELQRAKLVVEPQARARALKIATRASASVRKDLPA